MRVLVLLAAVVAVATASASTHAPSTTRRGADPTAPVTSVTTAHRVVYVNGKPTFLFGVWAADPNDGDTIRTLDAGIVDRLGVNTFVAPTRALASTLVGKAWVLVPSGPRTELASPLPNELGVVLEDEPDVKLILPALLAESTGDSRLVYENFATVRRENLAPYVQNLGAIAAVTYDRYPFNRDCASPDAGVAETYDLTQALKRTVTRSGQRGRDTPIGAWIEAVRIDGQSCAAAPTPAQVVGEAKAAVTAGATVVNWWTWSWLAGGPDQDAVTPAVAAAVRTFSAQARRLASVLLAPQVDTVSTSARDRLKVGARATSARTLAYLVLNPTSKPLRLKRRLPRLSATYVRELVTQHRLQTHDGVIVATIPAYDWRIYWYRCRVRPRR